MTRPIIILVEPQLAENIGMVARAMANFGLSELRLVSPRNGWPKKGAHSAASGAIHVLEGAKLYDTAREAIADLNFVFATTARERGQMKRVFGPDAAMTEAQRRLADLGYRGLYMNKITNQATVMTGSPGNFFVNNAMAHEVRGTVRYRFN